MSDERKALAARLREAAQGYHEWRVQHPETGAYCMAYSGWRGEIECAEWLADYRMRFPGGQHAGYEIKRVHVLTEADHLMLAAADALESAESDRAEAFRAGAEAMRRGCSRFVHAEGLPALAEELLALPLPTMPASAPLTVSEPSAFDTLPDDFETGDY